MGTIVYRASKAQAVHDELRDIASHATLLEHRVIGNRLWFVAQHHVDRGVEIAGIKWIGLTLIDCRDGEAAIKSMDETCGPCYYDCPLSFLDRADPPIGPHAGPRRDEVRAFQAARTSKRTSFRAGARVGYGDHTYVLRSCLGRRGWSVQREHDGLTFRMKGNQLAAAVLLPPSTDQTSPSINTHAAPAA